MQLPPPNALKNFLFLLIFNVSRNRLILLFRFSFFKLILTNPAWIIFEYLSFHFSLKNPSLVSQSTCLSWCTLNTLPSTFSLVAPMDRSQTTGENLKKQKNSEPEHICLFAWNTFRRSNQISIYTHTNNE